MKDYYENLKEEDILNLLFIKTDILIEYHLINLHNYLQKLPLIPSVEKLILFKNYCEVIEQIVLQFPHMMKFCPVFVFYDLNNVKAFLKNHYNIIEVFDKKGNLIKIKINEKWHIVN